MSEKKVQLKRSSNSDENAFFFSENIALQQNPKQL